MIENENIRERIRAKDKIIEFLEERVQDNTNRSIEALKLANYNEQYSLKHNIRMVNYPEKKGEILKNTEKFENVWFYNCNVYAKPEGKSRIRYDLFDNIDEKLKKKLKEGN